MLTYKNDMNTAQAVKILQDSIWNDDKLLGICGSRGFWFDESSDFVVHKDKISLLAHKRGKELKTKYQDLDEIVVFEKQYYKYDLNFSDIAEVHVYKDPYLLSLFPYCNKKEITTGYKIIDLFGTKQNNLKFIVLDNDFDKTMAAVSILFPNISIKHK